MKAKKRQERKGLPEAEAGSYKMPEIINLG